MVGDNLARVKDELHRVSKYASMVATQAEQVLKAQNDSLDELNNKMTLSLEWLLELVE